MPSIYFLTRKGKTNDPKNPAGKAVMDYIKEGHAPVNSDEIKQCVPSVTNPEGELDSLARAGFLTKENEGDNTSPFGR